MREMTPEMATLLKSKTMIGDNRPTHRITFEGMSGNLDILGSGEIPKKTYIGWRDSQGVGISTGSFSMFVPTNDDRFMTCFYHDGKLKVGYTPDERFFYDDYCLDPEEFIEYASITNPNTSENIIPLNTGWNITYPIPIYKRPDGKVIILITNPLANESNIVGDSRIDCLISNSGNGDDFQYYSNVFRLTPIGITYLSTKGQGSINAIKTITGIRLIAVMATQLKNSNYLLSQVKIFTSDDFGYSWTQRYAIGTGIGFTLVWSVAQAAQIPSGDVYTSITWSSTGSSLLISRDYGNTWSAVDGWEDDFGDEQVESLQGSFYYDEATNTIYRHSSWIATDGIYKVESPTPEIVEDKSKWETVTSLDNPYHTNFKGDIGTHFRKQPSGNIALLNTEGTSIAFIWGWRIWQNRVQAKKIEIQRQKGMAGGLTLNFDNKQGILAPDGTINPQLLWPNKEIIVEQGYGNELLQTFKGYIDNISMKTFPQTITIQARDSLKKALDQMIRTATGEFVVTFEGMKVEEIWTSLATRAGLTIGIVEATGLTLAEKTFSWETYGDAFIWLDELVGFETVCDEEGLVHFRRDGRPETVEVAYTFKEGEDIIQLGYEINDQDIYKSVVVYGERVVDEVEEVIVASRYVGFSDYYNILEDKILKIDAPDADTIEKCEIIADKAIYLMKTRARIVQFQSIGIPHLERGDFIVVIESSTTISEIYRITDISTSQDDKTYTMTITCYHHAAPEEVEE